MSYPKHSPLSTFSLFFFQFPFQLQKVERKHLLKIGNFSKNKSNIKLLIDLSSKVLTAGTLLRKHLAFRVSLERRTPLYFFESFLSVFLPSSSPSPHYFSFWGRYMSLDSLTLGGDSSLKQSKAKKKKKKKIYIEI